MSNSYRVFSLKLPLWLPMLGVHSSSTRNGGRFGWTITRSHYKGLRSFFGRISVRYFHPAGGARDEKA